MGYPDRPLIPPDFHHPNWWMDGVMLPLYLTSYDALAPVWRRAYEVSSQLWMKAMTSRSLACHWYVATPRKHAEALATAILEAKEAQR